MGRVPNLCQGGLTSRESKPLKTCSDTSTFTSTDIITSASFTNWVQNAIHSPASCAIRCRHRKKTPAMEVTGANPGGRVWRDVIMERAQKSRPHGRLEKTAFVHVRACGWVSHYLLLTKWLDSWKRMVVLWRSHSPLFKTKKAPPKRGFCSEVFPKTLN